MHPDAMILPARCCRQFVQYTANVGSGMPAVERLAIIEYPDRHVLRCLQGPYDELIVFKQACLLYVEDSWHLEFLSKIECVLNDIESSVHMPACWQKV